MSATKAVSHTSADSGLTKLKSYGQSFKFSFKSGFFNSTVSPRCANGLTKSTTCSLLDVIVMGAAATSAPNLPGWAGSLVELPLSLMLFWKV